MPTFRPRVLTIVGLSLLSWAVVFYFISTTVGATSDIIYEPPALAPRKPVVMSEPKRGEFMVSPATIRGKARGTWFFEASFPVTLNDANGTILGQGIAQAEGEWMTTAYVPFSLTLTFIDPPTTMGTLVFHKDNPSGLPEHDAQVSIPVRFQ